VDSALRALDEQLAGMAAAEKAEVLRASARALLVVAFRQEDYDVTVLPASCAFGLRVRKTTSGLRAEVTETRRGGDSKAGDSKAENQEP
jgi:hypothetical protein